MLFLKMSKEYFGFFLFLLLKYLKNLFRYPQKLAN